MKALIAEDDITSPKTLEALSARWGREPIPVRNENKAWKTLEPPELK